MSVKATFTLNLNQPMGTFDAAAYERIIHTALEDAGAPIVDVEFDGLQTIGEPLQATPLGPFEQSPVPIGGHPPPSPFPISPYRGF